MDKIHNGVLRKFHTLCSRLGLTEAEKRAIVESFGVESSADIDTHALIDVCASLSKQLEGDKGDQMDKLRKRAMAAIGGYLRKIDKESNLPFHRVPVFQQNTRRASAEPVQYIPQQTKGHGCGGAYRNGALGSKLHGGENLPGDIELTDLFTFQKQKIMSSNNNSSGAGIGFLGLLTIAFIVLKLTKCIAWSWWWVLAPMWMPLALVLLVVVIVGLCKLWIYCKWRARR
jgi:hypothetical protein